MSNDVLETLQKLPRNCYVVVPGNRITESIGIVKRGEPGYFKASVTVPDSMTRDHVKAVVADLNKSMGVTPAQAEAMLCGSMLGWHVPAADPDLYNEDGSVNADAAAKLPVPPPEDTPERRKSLERGKRLNALRVSEIPEAISESLLVPQRSCSAEELAAMGGTYNAQVDANREPHFLVPTDGGDVQHVAIHDIMRNQEADDFREFEIMSGSVLVPKDTLVYWE
jgi:hypothetical protein